MLLRSLESIKNAVKIYNSESDTSLIIKVYYGDASSEPIFNEKRLTEIQRQFSSTFTISYKFFNFNSGTAKGHNLLAKDCHTEYLLLINPDILFSPRFFIEILEPFNNQEIGVGIVEGRQTPIEHPKDYDLSTGETSWASGACTLISTALFHTVKGYDELFFMYCDDVDLSWRIRLLGKKVIYQPRAVVFHSKLLSQKGKWIPSSTEIQYSTEAKLLMLHKWSNRDVLKKTLKNYSLSGNENQLKAYNKYMELKKSKNLTSKTTRASEVSTFFNDSYSWHRFSI